MEWIERYSSWLSQQSGISEHSVWQRLLVQEFQDYGPCKVLILESEPSLFLAALTASLQARCLNILGNVKWSEGETQQILDSVKPNFIIHNYSLKKLENNENLIIHDKPFILIPTGGSSGKIRLVMHSWETLTASVQGFQQYFQVMQINSFCLLPLYHVSGLMQFIRCFMTGGKLMIQPDLDWQKWREMDVSKFFISLVPTQLQRFLNQPDWCEFLARFQAVLLGGAPAWDELLKEAEAKKIPLALTYGMTETASQIATLKPDDFRQGNRSVGKVLPHGKVEILDPEGEVLGMNQMGQIAISAQSLALGYYPEFFDPNQPFLTDDLGYLDTQGYLYIVGRKSQKIITGGENVYPAEVEAAIRKSGLVEDVVVLGLPDGEWGEVVTALYVPVGGGVSGERLKQAVLPLLSRYKVPKHWLGVPKLPRNAQGKLNYAAIKVLAQELDLNRDD